MYTSYRVKGVIKPEYVELVKDFMQNHQWDVENAPPCIQRWHRFLEDIGSVKRGDDQSIIAYHNRIPFGLPSPWWGNECIVYEDYDSDNVWWSFSGEMKNDRQQIEYFMEHVMSELCSTVPLYWTCDEDDDVFRKHATPVLSGPSTPDGLPPQYQTTKIA